MARFFCDNCGTEVKRNSSRCPECGRLFAFVRCPQCSYTAEESNFTKGCPVCGYCTPPQKKNAQSQKPLRKPSLVAAGKLPPWVYLVAALGLLTVVVVLFLIIR